MRLSFQFDDFFRDKHQELTHQSNIKTPAFLLQSGVVGDLKIKDLKDNLIHDQNARIELEFEGFMKTELDTSVDSRSEFRVTVEKKILSMTQALSLQGHARNSSNNERHYPFNFNVQSWLQHDQESQQDHRAMASRSNFASIPPSLKHEVLNTPRGVPKPRAGARVTYRLTARLLKDRRTIQRIAHPILLMLSQIPSPPICLADFTGEYRLAQTSVLKGSMFQKMGEISAIAQEPRQLSIRADSVESMVEIPVKLRWERPRQDSPTNHNTCMEAEINWQFQSSTFVSIVEQKGPATLEQAMASPATAFVKSSLEARKLRLAWRHWKVMKSTETSKILESEQSVWLTIPRSEVLTPTFWSSFLSRRYSISLQIKLLKPGTAKLEIEVPIQVGIEAATLAPYEDNLTGCREGAGGDDIFANLEGDELLPQYSRSGPRW